MRKKIVLIEMIYSVVGHNSKVEIEDRINELEDIQI